jgi:dihydropyrimidinase
VLGQELPALIREGYTSFKIYLTYERLRLDDREALEVLALARREGALVMVHAENHDVVEWLTGRLLAEGRKAPKYHAVAHAGAAEREATQRAITLAEVAEAPVLIVHVSGREAIDQIRWAKARGLRVHAETCPQYLFLSDKDLDRPGFDGAMFMCSCYRPTTRPIAMIRRGKRPTARRPPSTRWRTGCRASNSGCRCSSPKA